MTDYRKWLIAAEQKSQEDFDKTVLSLSGERIKGAMVELNA